MRYILLIYSRESDEATADESAAVAAAHRTVMEDAVQQGVFRAAEPFESTALSTTVRVRNGGATITDGPFAETKEQLAGYYIIDCRDLDEALEWAGRIPTECGGGSGCVEVRPIREMR